MALSLRRSIRSVSEIPMNKAPTSWIDFGSDGLALLVWIAVIIERYPLQIFIFWLNLFRANLLSFIYFLYCIGLRLISICLISINDKVYRRWGMVIQKYLFSSVSDRYFRHHICRSCKHQTRGSYVCRAYTRHATEVFRYNKHVCACNRRDQKTCAKQFLVLYTFHFILNP